MKTQASIYAAQAETLYRAGDYGASVRALYQALRLDPDLFETEAVRRVASVRASDRSQFWTKPEGFYPAGADLKGIFEFIYERGVWGGGSGAGSNLEYTVPYIAYLQAFMERHAIGSVLDLGCGDWRFSRRLDFTGRHYLGLDIVPLVIAANNAAYGASNIRFEQADLAAEAWPSTDLIVSKDVFQHLSNNHVTRILEKCRGAKFVLITNDYHPANADCADGETRPLDISASPFRFPARPVLSFGGKITFLAELGAITGKS